MSVHDFTVKSRNYAILCYQVGMLTTILCTLFLIMYMKLIGDVTLIGYALPISLISCFLENTPFNTNDFLDIHMHSFA